MYDFGTINDWACVIANFTRFYILSKTLTLEHLSPKGASFERALVRLSSSPAALSGTSTPTITQFLVALNLPTIRMDRRPSSYPIPFHDVYLVEVQRDSKDEVITQRVQKGTKQSWISEVKAGLERVRDIGAEAALLGVW